MGGGQGGGVLSVSFKRCIKKGGWGGGGVLSSVLI